MRRLYVRVLEDLENLQRLGRVSKPPKLEISLPDENLLKLCDSNNELLRNLLSQEEALGVDLKSVYYPCFVTPSPASHATADVAAAGDQITESSDSQDGISEVSLDDIVGVEEDFTPADDVDLTAAANFIKFTYWAIEDKVENTSTCKRGLYTNNTRQSVTLLEDSEAFVAKSLTTASQSNTFLNTPRHLLLQVAQVTSRAFFDPHYRSYLINKYQ